MNKYSVDCRWSEEDGAFVAVCPELGQLSALGSTAKEAVEELEIAVSLALETYEEEGWPLPNPQTTHCYSGQFRVRLPRSLHAWLVSEAEQEGVSLNSFVISSLSEIRGARYQGTPVQGGLHDPQDAVPQEVFRQLLAAWSHGRSKSTHSVLSWFTQPGAARTTGVSSTVSRGFEVGTFVNDYLGGHGG